MTSTDRIRRAFPPLLVIGLVIVLLAAGMMGITAPAGLMPGTQPGPPTPLAAPTALSTQPVTPGAAMLTFTPDADARVEEANPDMNFGLGTTLRADGGSSPDIESYLRFTVSGVPGPIMRATLRLYATTNGTANGPALYAADSAWAEKEITWHTRPARTGGVIDNTGAIETNAWVEYNVTPLFTGGGPPPAPATRFLPVVEQSERQAAHGSLKEQNGNRTTLEGTFSFALIADSDDGVIFSSREGSAPPQLVLVIGGDTPTPTPAAGPAGTPTPLPTGEAVLAGAGDIADCSSDGDEATARLLDTIAGTVFTAGDNAYESGTSAEFANCYDPSWGRHKARTRPAAGNHEYRTAGARGYFSYFGAAAGAPGQGYYSYDLGTWHIVVLNSNCDRVGGCDAGSPQEQWLRADLAAHPSACTLAYWHHPRFSSGPHGSHSSMQAFWQALYEANADVVLNGHDHDYERFAPQDPTGQADAARGIREFVVGMGGKNHYTIDRPIANSELHNDDTFGVLKLTLHPTGYDWQFIPAPGKTFSDTGSTACH